MKMNCQWFDFGFWLSMREKPVILVQASNSRLSESSKNSPLSLFELLLRWGTSVLSKEQSRSGEKVPLKRTREKLTVPQFELSLRQECLA